MYWVSVSVTVEREFLEIYLLYWVYRTMEAGKYLGGRGHLVQPPAKSRSVLNSDQFAPALSSWTLKTPKHVDSAASLDSFFQCLIILTQIFLVLILIFPFTCIQSEPSLFKSWLLSLASLRWISARSLASSSWWLPLDAGGLLLHPQGVRPQPAALLGFSWSQRQDLLSLHCMNFLWACSSSLSRSFWLASLPSNGVTAPSLSVVCKIGALCLFQVTGEKSANEIGPRLKNSTGNWCPSRIQTTGRCPLSPVMLPVFHAPGGSSDTITSPLGRRIAVGSVSAADLAVTGQKAVRLVKQFPSAAEQRRAAVECWGLEATLTAYRKIISDIR